MSLHMPITRQRIRNHFHYNVWKYVLLAALAVFGWNLLYTTTRYRAPENLKVEFYCEAYGADDAGLQALMDEAHAAIMPEMEEVTSTVLTFNESYGAMQLTVWISAAQGDVYLLSQERFDAAGGAMLPLQPLLDDERIPSDVMKGIDLDAGYFRGDDGVKTLCGIPADSLSGLTRYGIDPTNKVLSLLYNGGNDEYSLKLFNWLLEKLR